MIDTRENAQAIVDLFNRFLETDPEAASKLFLTRVPCNDFVADLPGVVTVGEPGCRAIGIIGLLNSLFSDPHRLGMWTGDVDSVDEFVVADFSVKEDILVDSEEGMGEFIDQAMNGTPEFFREEERACSTKKKSGR